MARGMPALVVMLSMSALAGCQKEAPTELRAPAPAPLQMVEVGSVAPRDGAAYLEDLAIDRWYAYAVTNPDLPDGYPSSGLYVFNISSPATPWEVSFVRIDGTRSIAVDNAYAYVGTKAGLRILDIRDPASVQPVATYGNADVVALSTQAQFLSVATSQGLLTVLDMKDPARPEICATVTTGLTNVRGMAQSGEYVAITGDPNALLIYDIDNPRTPSRVARFDGDSAEYQDDWEVWYLSPRAGGIVYKEPYFSAEQLVVSARGGYVVYDVSVSPPRQRAVADLQPSPNAWLATRNRVFTDGAYQHSSPTSWLFRLKAYDTSNPLMPREIGSLPLGSHATSIRTSGKYLFVTTMHDGLRVFRLD